MPESDGNRPVVIGAVTAGTSPAVYFNGIIDDVRVYDRALAAEEVWQLYQNGLEPEAFGPNPADDDTEIDPDTILGWSPGGYALFHDVYFGTDYNDVNDANTTDLDVFVGNQDSNSWDPCGLEYGSTYYWRIDEVSSSGTAKGDVWSFTTWGEPNLYLVGWWQLDEGDGNTAYDSAGDNDGNLVGDPCWVPGYVGTYALDFDGAADYVDVNSSAELELDLNGTISAWVRAEDLYQHSIVNKRGGSDGGNKSENYWLTFGSVDNCSIVIGDGANYCQALFEAGQVSTDEWHHLVGTWSTVEMSIYLDGMQKDVETNTLATVTSSNSYPLRIGYDSRAGWYFDGKIDDVRIYDRALSAEEIQQLYQEGLN
jgi:hypothetical protein